MNGGVEKSRGQACSRTAFTRRSRGCRTAVPGSPMLGGLLAAHPDRTARAPHHSGKGGKSPNEQTAQHTFSSSSLYQQCAQSQLNFPSVFRSCLPYRMKKNAFFKDPKCRGFPPVYFCRTPGRFCPLSRWSGRPILNVSCRSTILLLEYLVNYGEFCAFHPKLFTES